VIQHPFAISEVAALTSYPEATLRRLVATGRIATQLFAGVPYIDWESFVNHVNSQRGGATALKLFHWAADTTSKMAPPFSRAQRDVYLRERGWVAVPAVCRAVHLARGTVYRWLRSPEVQSLVFAGQVYVCWATLVRWVSTLRDVGHREDEPPPLHSRARKITRRGWRVQPDSQSGLDLAARGYISIAEAASQLDVPAQRVRGCVRYCKVAAERLGASVFVHVDTLKAYLETQVAT
jgi:hypothetical protein